MAPSLRTTVGGVSLECCIYNASGPKSGHIADLANIGKTQAGAVLSKSATLEKQSGNPLPRLKKIPLNGKLCEGSINSEGLPNAGIDYYISDTVLDGVAATGKPYIVSRSGLKVEHNVEMLGRIVEAHGKAPKKIAGVELNLACPNIPGKPTVALDFEQMDDVQKLALTSVFQALEDAGLEASPGSGKGRAFDRSETAVILGNSMGGKREDKTNFRVFYPKAKEA